MSRASVLGFLSKRRNIIIEIISALFIVLFVYTAMSKLSDYRFFVAQLNTHPGIGPYANTLAWLVPTAELLIVAMLMIPRTKIMGLYSSLAIMTAFTIYLLLMLKYGENLPCSCGGVIKYMTWREHVAFNSGFIILALFALWLRQSRRFRDEERTKVAASFSH